MTNTMVKTSHTHWNDATFNDTFVTLRGKRWYVSTREPGNKRVNQSWHTTETKAVSVANARIAN